MSDPGQRPITMPEPAADVIVRNLIEALERLREDLDRMELWAAALGSFQHSIPDYRPATSISSSLASEPTSRRPGIEPRDLLPAAKARESIDRCGHSAAELRPFSAPPKP